MDIKQEAIKEAIKRELEARNEPIRSSLLEYVKYMFKNHKNKQFDDNWHYKVITDPLENWVKCKIKGERCANRIIINVPPGSGKTEIATKLFPTWALGRISDIKVIATSYSATLSTQYGQEARDYYRSSEYLQVFPFRSKIRDDQDTKGLWVNEDGGSYLSQGVGGSITGNRGNIFIIDDPLKPNESYSDLMRQNVISWYENTVLSRLFNPLLDLVVIIMQRTHSNDLCGYLIEKELSGNGEKWLKIVLPALGVTKSQYREEGEALQINRYPKESLELLRQSMGNVNFECQYQQNPISKETQEFHEEWWRYYDEPIIGRTFTCVDPAFSKSTKADETAICTVSFTGDKCDILEISYGKWNPSEMEAEIIRHVRVWNPETIGIESYQAQAMIGFSLRNSLQKQGIYKNIEEITQKGDKETKLRRLIPLYNNGLIRHRRDSQWSKKLELQLMQFPRGAHDDLPDALQMCFELYELTPKHKINNEYFEMSYNKWGQPDIITNPYETNILQQY